MPVKKTNAANRFTAYVLKMSPKLPTLPLVHTTDSHGFREILERGKLKPRRCPVFENEDLIYLYYGRPGYRVGADIKPTSLTAYYPVCFVLDPKCVKTSKRVYPFDSGAYHNDLFENHIHHNMRLDSFIVEPNLQMPGKIPTPDTPARIVSSFFGDNNNYYSGTPLDSIEVPPLEFEVECYCNLIKSKGQTALDDRRSTIEIQIDKPINLTKRSVNAVALPSVFIEDPDVKDKIIRKWKAEVLDYYIYHSNPSQFTASILEKVRDFLKREGFL